MDLGEWPRDERGEDLEHETKSWLSLRKGRDVDIRSGGGSKCHFGSCADLRCFVLSNGSEDMQREPGRMRIVDCHAS